MFYRRAAAAGALAAVLLLTTLASGMAATGTVGSPTSTGPTDASSGCTLSEGQTVSGAGSTFVAPLLDQWEASFDGETLNFQSVGSGTGVTDLAVLSTDFAASDTPITPAQNKTFEGNPVLTMPETASAVSLIYNLPGTWHQPLNLSANVLANIFDGTVTTWNAASIQALNPSDTLPSTQIIVVHRSDLSGTSYALQQFLSYDAWQGGTALWTYNYSSAWLGPDTIPGEIGAKGDGGVSSEVQATVGAISYTGLEYAEANGLSMAAVENPRGTFVVPTLADSTSALEDKVAEAGFTLPSGLGNWSLVNLLNPPGANDYPITTFTYLNFYEAPDVAFGTGSSIMTQDIAQALWVFLNWSVSSSAGGGQTYSAPLYYIPLPAVVTQADRATIALMTWDGAPIDSCAGSLAAVSISPSPVSLLTGGAEDLFASPVCSGGPCPFPILYSWTTTNSLGGLNATSGSTVSFLAGASPGSDTVFVNASLGPVTVEASVSISIASPSAPALASVSISPSTVTLDLGEGAAQPFVATVACTVSTCPADEISLTWQLVPPGSGLGTLGPTSGSLVYFTPGDAAGTVALEVIASWNGKVAYANATINLVAPPPGPSPSSQGGWTALDTGVAVAAVAVIALVGALIFWTERRTRRMPPPPRSASPPDAPRDEPPL